MAKIKVHRFLGAIAGTALATTALSTQFAPPGQAATLTYNFQFDSYASYYGAYTGWFTIDNSSLTGQGQESVPVLSGTFNFLKPIVGFGTISNFITTPHAFDLSNPTGSSYVSNVQFYDGQFLGLWAYGGVAADQSDTFWSWSGPITMNAWIGWNIQGNNLYGSSSHYKSAFLIGGDVSYSEPVEIPANQVPEPTTIAGLGLGIVGFLRAKMLKKTAA